MLLQQPPVACAAPGVMQHDQIEHGGVGGAVIGRMGDQLEVRQFAGAQLVHDLARLRVAVVVALCRLQPSQHVQRAAGAVGIDDGGLQRHS